MRIAIHRRPFSRTLVRVAAVVLVGAACSDVAGGDHPGTDPRVGANLLPTTGIPTTAADIRGTITAVQTGVDTRPTGGGGPPGGSVSCPPDCGASGPPLQAVLIEEVPGSTGGDHKSYVTVLRTARVLRQTASGAEPASFADLKVGQRVDAWFTGPVRQSYPSQADAGVVVIRDE